MYSQRIVWVFWLLCTAVGSAQSSHPVASPQSNANIAGIVVNDVTGKPLDNVHIRLVSFAENAPSAVYGAMSDTAGHFSISGIAPSNYLVMLEHSGFIAVPGHKNAPAANGVLTLKPGDQFLNLALRMTPRPIISGHVFNEYGDPMMNVSVTAVPLTPQTMTDVFSEATTTNDRGEFRIVAPPGRYHIKASSWSGAGGQSEIRTDGSVESNYVDTYFPGTATEHDATMVEARPGRELHDIDIHLARTPVLSISGRVVNIPDGVHSLSLELDSGPNPHRMTSGSNNVTFSNNEKLDGKFQFGHLNPGFYRLSGSCVADGKPLRSQTVEVNLTDSHYQGVELVLAPGADVTGLVEWGERPSAQKSQSEKHSVKLRPISNPFAYIQMQLADISADGTFTLPNVFADRYKVEIDPMPENSFIKEVQIDGKTVPDGLVDFSNGAEGSHLKIILSPNGGQVSGHVTDENGAILTAFAQVLLVSHQNPEQRDFRLSKVTSEGMYRFNGLPPGHYRLFAQDITTRRNDIYDTIQQYWDKATVVEIKEGQNISKDVKLISDEERNGQ